ncbi:hypothetical protein SISSUDRAFT_476135 [Sistotremastrum suecicum HHB10207 ss-3]|uniref:Secreted protein n=1 Tax=Sistotremastrum suecicum HHB10207 ss-3 TaxID=1314776 RepID=A0A165Y340_9AGAM|nr:hypothetical protein SISSUDRAFT_476135 [Sistotremastrum suecicum HHB10207 ss-3]
MPVLLVTIWLAGLRENSAIKGTEFPVRIQSLLCSPATTSVANEKPNGRLNIESPGLANRANNVDTDPQECRLPFRCRSYQDFI